MTRWHRSGARPVDRAREVARTCWEALSKVDPDAARLIGRAAMQAGEGWLTPQLARHGPEDLISPVAAGELVGVSSRTVYEWVSSGRLPHSVDQRGRIRVRVDAVLAAEAL